MSLNSAGNIPNTWFAPAQHLWLAGQRFEAIQSLLARLNSYGANKPAQQVLQLAYYLFLVKDFQVAATVLETQLQVMPHHTETALNLAVCYSRLNRHADAIRLAKVVLESQPDNTVAWEIVCAAESDLGNREAASQAGTQVLMIRDRNAQLVDPTWSLPAGEPNALARQPGKRDIISFSLWGQHPRYLRGAVQNILLAKNFYPQWKLRFYGDDSLPAEFCEVLQTLGAEVCLQSSGQTVRQKLCWRFLAANDPTVGYFMVRDVDSVFNPREARAVKAWLASGKWFHVMRDWWTHTDLILAGMWGGVAGVLPSLAEMVIEYTPAAMETPNVDQWFLRDRIWPFVRQSALVHDRFFRMPISCPWPDPDPPGEEHVGQNEFSAQREVQAEMLLPVIKRFPAVAKLLGFNA